MSKKPLFSLSEISTKKDENLPKQERTLSYIFDPKAVAVVGASTSPSKVGYAVLKNILSSGYKGDVYPINARFDGKILGKQTYKSLCDVKGDIDVAVVCVPARFVLGVLDDMGKKKIRGCCIITAGFKEIGEEGAILEKKLCLKLKEINCRCIGPNCLGYISKSLNASFASLHTQKGGVAMISQSGAMMTAILDYSYSELKKMRFSNFVSIGNKADLDEIDLILDSGQDDETKIVSAYVESVKDGQKFLDRIPEVTSRKPVVILKSGRSIAGQRAASSHTGALAQDDKVFTLAFRKVGVIRAYTMREFFNLSRCFTNMVPPNGTKFAIVTNAGGPGIITTDAFSRNGIELSEIPERVQEILGKNLRKEASLVNPIDIIGDATPDKYESCLMDLFGEMSDDECAGAVVLVSPQSQTDPDEVARVIVRVHHKFPTKCLLACFLGGKSMRKAKEILSQRTENYPCIPNYEFPEQAAKALRYVLDYYEWKKKYNESLNVQPSPTSVSSHLLHESQFKRITEIFKFAKKQGRSNLTSYETSEIMSFYRISNPATRLCTKFENIEKTSEEVGYPVAMKISSPDIVHKSDVGGVKLWIRSDEEARKCWKQMMIDVADLGPKNARIVGVEMQQMINYKAHDKVTEMIVGIHRDPTFGPLLMVGQGGKYANYLKDVAFEIIHNYNWEAATKQLARTKIYAVLEGVRKDKRSDIVRLIGAMCKIAKFANSFPCVKELDLNPLCVFEEKKGVMALDIKITIDLEKVGKRKDIF